LQLLDGTNEGDADSEKDGNFSTLRELLIRPASLGGEGSAPASPASPAGRSAKGETTDDSRKVKSEEEVIIIFIYNNYFGYCNNGLHHTLPFWV